MSTLKSSEETGRGKVGPRNPPKEYQWKPGQSGNPNGRPSKENCLTSLLKEAMKMVDKKKKLTYAQLLVITLINRALLGDTKAIDMILDRVDGKVVQPVSGPGGGPIPFDLERKVIYIGKGLKKYRKKSGNQE